MEIVNTNEFAKVLLAKMYWEKIRQSFCNIVTSCTILYNAPRMRTHFRCTVVCIILSVIIIIFLILWTVTLPHIGDEEASTQRDGCIFW